MWVESERSRKGGKGEKYGVRREEEEGAGSTKEKQTLKVLLNLTRLSV